MASTGQWRATGTSVSGLGYGYHVVRCDDGGRDTGWGVLLYLGQGVILGRGAVERVQPVASHDEAVWVGDAWCRAHHMWRAVQEQAVAW